MLIVNAWTPKQLIVTATKGHRMLLHVYLKKRYILSIGNGSQKPWIITVKI